jgi:L-xylulokinase
VKREQCAIGLDIGLSATKAVAFTADGGTVARAERESVNSQPVERWVERDPNSFKATVFGTLADLSPQLEDREIVGISQAAHGDGIWVLGQDGEPLRPGILSLDSRAREAHGRFSGEPLARRLTEVTGQVPMISSAPTVLAWLKAHEPDVYSRIRHLLFSKDMARLWLTGQIAQDYTEVSSCFTAVGSQQVSEEAFDLYGLEEAAAAVPPVLGSADLAGRLTAEAAAATGLPQGLPVAAGLHDIVAGSLGAGAVFPGAVSVIAGSYCVNQCVTDQPQTGPWLTRSFISPGMWNLIKASPSSSTNLDWYAKTLLPDLVEGSRAARRGTFGFLGDLFEGMAPLLEDSPFYLPFLYGSPLPVEASAGLVGLRSWHSRADTVRAVFEGVALNHRQHLDALPVPADAVPKVMGGISRNPYWIQLLADLLGRPVEVSTRSEPGALGAAMTAFLAAGVYPDLDTAVTAMIQPGVRVEPGPAADLMDSRYQRYAALVESLTGWWRP